MSVTKVHDIHAVLDRLDQVGAHYTITRVRDDALLVEVAVPGEHWEIEFFTDGHVEVERYKSDGTIGDESALPEMFTHFEE